MILQKEKERMRPGAIRRRSKFAFWPTRMKRDTTDRTGNLIWLETYVVTEEMSYRDGWRVIRTLRTDDHVLAMLRDDEAKSDFDDEAKSDVVAGQTAYLNAYQNAKRTTGHP